MDYKEEYKKYLDVTKENFKEKWGNLSFTKEDTDVVINKWLAIYNVFFDFNQYSDKSKNGFFNDIREIALFNLFTIDPEELNVLDGHDLENIKEKLKDLQEEWIGAVVECADRETKTTAKYRINSFTKMGGRMFPYDFTWNVTKEGEDNEMDVKIEFKFSNSKNTSIVDLAELFALNTESANGLIIFDNKSYLDFFWDENYLKKMCEILNLTEEETPSNKKNGRKLHPLTQHLR